ncbi:peptidyl-prolyl cis-trans isomerase-like 4 isoform X5 [Acipenser oxyrinchus oxyrinchus]|uniref:Peptidyl-prolyl cis-trans isomerase-like 4 isoform X5 n=1 Tax=Acipenser oxyrinchus oxyrinchus TaxID=40147 RepID=A0AAD8GCB0_ACIOX|nr:peptidyl-prolyl cis-trans isomerase-like 4 isoform X5 [Acipenser oxyrinchus oxyrinchus]
MAVLKTMLGDTVIDLYTEERPRAWLSEETLDYLDGIHAVFGEVTEGMDVLMKINEAFVDKDFLPFQDIRINHTVILDDPLGDPHGLPIPDRSPEPTKEQLDVSTIVIHNTL